MSVSGWTHPLFRWYNTHSVYDIISPVYMAQYPLHMISHPWFMTSKHYTNGIKAIISKLTPIIRDSTSTVSLSSHQIIDHTTPILCMITHPQYVWHHINYIWHHIHSLWYHTMLCHDKHCIHVITPRLPVIASTVAGPLLIVYWLYHTYYMSDMKPTLCMTSQEFYMTSHSLFMT